MGAHEPTSFWRENVIAIVILLNDNENVIVGKTSYQMLGILSFGDQERALPPSMEISIQTFVVK